MSIWLEEPIKRRGTTIYLHVHSVGEVHGWYRNFWTSKPYWWLHCDRVSSLLVDFVFFVNLIDDEFWITICFGMLDTNLLCKLHSDQQSIIFRNIIGTRLS